MMKVIFHTNMDPKYCEWYFPKEVCCKPEIGELIKPTNGDQILRVCSITHCYGKLLFEDYVGPYLEVELTKRNQ